MDLTPDLIEQHRGLSHAHVRFLEFVRRNPECLRRDSFSLLDQRDAVVSYGVQSWPLFLSRARLAELNRANVSLIELVKGLPSRVFGNDPARLAEFYRTPPEHAVLITAALEKTECLAGAIGRGDFIETTAGFKCCELNMSGNLGGWQMAAWLPKFLSIPVMGRFLAESGIEISVTHPFHVFTRHAFAHARRGRPELERFDLAMLLEATPKGAWVDYLRGEYRFVRDELGFAGDFFVGEERALRQQGRQLFLGEQPIDAVLFAYLGPIGSTLYGALMAGAADVYNGPLAIMLSDKTNLALLSELVDSEVFTAQERAAIRDHVPWSRRVADDFVDYGDERVYLPDLLLNEQARLVLKLGVSMQGSDVYLGRSTPPAVWSDLVRAALDEGGWVVQELLDPVRHIFQEGEEGCEPHDIVWGIYDFGGRYGGGFLRLKPASGTGVVNRAQGARDGVIFEVDA